MNAIAQGMWQINRATRTAIAFDRLRCLNGDDTAAAKFAMERCPFDFGSAVLLVTPRCDYWRMFNQGLN